MMKYICSPNNPARFATNLRQDKATKKLMWDCANGQDVMIVQTPYGSSAVDRINEICEKLPNITVMPEKYMEVITGIWVRFVSAAERARNSGCPINGEASTYTVFSCYTQNGTCEIYMPQSQAMISPFCNIPLDLHVVIKNETRREGSIFRKREVDTGFMSISFPNSFGAGYVDGDLSYKIENIEIPITKEIIEHGVVYVFTEAKPVIISHNKGLRII